MKRLMHWLAHKLGSNTGEVTTWWQGDKLMIGFRCDGCGEVSGAHESATSRGAGCAVLKRPNVRAKAGPTAPLKQDTETRPAAVGPRP